MALGLVSESTGSGDIIPIVKYDAKAGDFIRVDREQAPNGIWDKTQTEIELPTQVVMDFANIETGWLSFDSGAPDFHMVKIGQPALPRPSEHHKPAFRVRLFNKELGLREMSSQAKTVIREMDSLHNEYVSGAADNAGKVPVVTISGTKAVTVNTPNGENRFKVPQWSITDWIERPDAMQGEAEPPAATTGTSDYF